MDERGFRGVPFAADNMLENMLNQCAEEAYRSLAVSTRGAGAKRGSGGPGS